MRHKLSAFGFRLSANGSSTPPDKKSGIDQVVGVDHELIFALKQDLRTSSASITASSCLVRSTQLRCRARARELKQQETMRPLWIACALAFGWAVLSMPFVWQGFEWLGQSSRLPGIVWQTGFLVVTLMPIAAVGTVGLASRFQKRTA